MIVDAVLYRFYGFDGTSVQVREGLEKVGALRPMGLFQP